MAPTATTATIPGFVIEDASYVVPAEGRIHSVSPDGETLLVGPRDQVCIQPLDGSATTCATSPSGFTLEQMSGDWTPDGSMVAFTDRRATSNQFLSTVWALETRTLDLELISDRELTALDVTVAPDGTVVVSGTTERRSGLFTVGGSDPPRPLAGHMGLAHEWLPDGSALLQTSGSDDPGLWRVDPAGSVDLVAQSDDFPSRPELMAISPSGEWVLVRYRKMVTDFQTDVSHVGLVRLATGEVTPLKQSGGSGFFGPGMAAFSPDSRWVAYTYSAGVHADLPDRLAVRSTTEDGEGLLIEDLASLLGPPPNDEPFFLHTHGPLRAVWTDSGHLLLPTANWLADIELRQDPRPGVVHHQSPEPAGVTRWS